MQKLYDAMRLLGIPMPNKDTDTGLIIRWGRNNRYWLKKFEGGYVFGDFVTDQSSHVFEQEYRGKKLAQYREKMQKALRDVEVKSSKMHEMASTKASFILTSAQHTSQNRYLERKKVRLHDLKLYKNYLIVPACDNNGKIWTIQFIDMDGNKRFLSGGKKKGCYYTIGSLDDVEKIFICEGYATGATIYECTEVPVIVAFDAGNLSSVAQAIREKYQNIKIVICADNDQYGSINTGLEKAKEAAASVGGSIVVPKFKDTSTHPTDFNDLFVLEGKDSVVSALKEQMQEETTFEKFISSDQGLFWVDSKGKMSRLSNYINVTAFVRSDNGISKLVEFKDYKNEMQQLIVKPNMIVRDGEQIRVLLTNQGFVYAGTPLSKRKLFEYIMSASPTKEATLNAARYYGTPAIAFIEKVLMSTNEIRQKFQEEFQNLKTQYLPIKAEGQDQRAFEHFMFAGFAGELAIKYGIVDWKPGTAYAAAIACFNSWLEDKDGVGDDENRQILEQVKAFFELHGHSRFFDLDGFKDQKIANMAGYKTVYKDAVTFFVSPSAFQNEICRNFARKSVINLLIEKGFLLKDHNGDYRQQKWTPDGNKKVYVISGKILL